MPKQDPEREERGRLTEEACERLTPAELRNWRDTALQYVGTVVAVRRGALDLYSRLQVFEHLTGARGADWLVAACRTALKADPLDVLAEDYRKGLQPALAALAEADDRLRRWHDWVAVASWMTQHSAGRQQVLGSSFVNAHAAAFGGIFEWLKLWKVCVATPIAWAWPEVLWRQRPDAKGDPHPETLRTIAGRQQGKPTPSPDVVAALLLHVRSQLRPSTGTDELCCAIECECAAALKHLRNQTPTDESSSDKGAPASDGPEQDPHDTRCALLLGKRVYLGNDTETSRLFWLLARPVGAARMLGEVQRAIDGMETDPAYCTPEDGTKALQRVRKVVSKLRKRLRDAGLQDHVVIHRSGEKTGPEYAMIRRFP